MPTLVEQREVALKAARDIAEAAKKESRDLTADEVTEVNAKMTEVDGLDVKIKAAKESADLMARINALGPVADDDDEPGSGAKSLGEHFVKSVGRQGLERIKSVGNTTLAAPEFKAYQDPQKVPSDLAPWLTDLDNTIVRAFRRPVVSDLLGSGTISGNSIAYLVEGGMETSAGSSDAFPYQSVAEAAAKPQFHLKDPVKHTASLVKLAGFLEFSDEVVEDAPFWVSEINNRGLYMLALAEEWQLINGNGGGDLTGILNAGIGSEAATWVGDNADAIFRAITGIQNVTGLTPDGIVINPADYEKIRLSKDNNGQYYGGGIFTGPYGNGGLDYYPPLWGLRTVVSPAVAAGTALVGAFAVAATVYRKGGVRVESTNSHASTFTSNIITTRIEERVALAVRVPYGFTEVTFSSASSPSSPGGL